MKRLLFLLLFLGLGPASSVLAQGYAQTERVFIQSPMALGMGDAAVAFPSLSTGFFYNPAHFAQATGLRPRINLLGVRVSASSNLKEQADFYRDELEPAIDGGIENLSDAEQRALYTRALELGRRKTVASGDVLLPSVTLGLGPLGAGAGVFGRTLLRYRFPNAGAGIPAVDLVGQADAIGVAAAGLDLGALGAKGLSVGGTAKYTQRWLSFKNKPLDAFSENEDFYIFTGSAVGLDLGLLYEVGLPLPGALRLGAAAYDVASSDFDYVFEDNLNDEVPDAAYVERQRKLATASFQPSPSYRVGASYMLPSLLGVFGETGVAVDYLVQEDAPVEQTGLAALRLGAQARLGLLALRAGLSQGYTTFGAGLHLGFLSIEYAFYGVEEGRMPGQLGSWHHTAQLRLGL